MSGIAMAGVTYACRVCTTTRTVYVLPREVDPERDDMDEVREGDLIIDTQGKHRLASADCEECGCERTHVIQPERDSA